MARFEVNKVLFILSCVFLFTVISPISAFPADIAGKSRTLLNARENIFKERIYRVYEYVDLSLTNMGDSGLSVHASGWGRYNIDGPYADDRQEGELAYAYFSVPIKSLDARVNFGRQFVYAGASSEQIDGIYITTGFRGFTASLFGGSPPEMAIDNSSGDGIYGGRLSHGVKGRYEIGVSYLKEKNDSLDFREEYGVDIWLRPTGWLSLQGISTYNELTSGWMEHTYRLTAANSGKLMAYGEYSMVDYGHFFNTSTSAAFSSLWLNPRESTTSRTIGIELKLSDSMNLSARYKNLDYELAGGADSYGTGITYSAGNKLAGLSIDRASGDTDVLRYTMYRAFASLARKKADITVDLATVDYDVKRAGIDRTLSATGALGYSPMKNLKASLELTYEENPLFSNETRALMKLNHRFGAI